MAFSSAGKITVAQVLVPVALTGFVLCLILGFQTTQIMRDRGILQDTQTQQAQQLDQARKVQAQLEALALGTKRLAQNGDKDAQGIIDRMQQAGISVGNPGPAPGQTPPPGAMPGMPMPPAAAPPTAP